MPKISAEQASTLRPSSQGGDWRIKRLYICATHLSIRVNTSFNSQSKGPELLSQMSSKSLLSAPAFDIRRLIKQFSQRPFSPKPGCLNNGFGFSRVLFFFVFTQLHLCLGISFELVGTFPSSPPYSSYQGGSLL